MDLLVFEREEPTPELPILVLANRIASLRQELTQCEPQAQITSPRQELTQCEPRALSPLPPEAGPGSEVTPALSSLPLHGMESQKHQEGQSQLLSCVNKN